MSVEQRVLQAFRYADRVEPSDDLWSRVVHSIEEDRLHRRRVVGTALATAAVSTILIGIGALSVIDGATGRFVDRETLEILEATALAMLTIVLGPAIRRFGRGYAHDLWPAYSSTPRILLRLLDVAYFLVFGGYVLVSTEFEFGDDPAFDLLGGQLQEASARIGGLLLVMALLHAGTLLVLPLVALVDSSTRASRRLPRWIVLIGASIVLAVVPVVVMLFAFFAAEL